jgi:hypothetical protein
MAEFSKQWCDMHDPKWPWDFDLDEEFNNMQPGEWGPLICEGFGFVGILKQLDGSKYCLFVDYKSRTEIKEVSYEALLSESLLKKI